MPTNPVRLLVLTVGGVALAALACGFAYITNTTTNLPIKWPPGSVQFRIMVDNTVTKSDGLTLAGSMQVAMSDITRGWNHNLGDFQFNPVITAVGNGADGNGINEVFFSSTPYSMSWDSNTLAVTTTWYIGNQRAESDTIFNTAFTWDSFRGNLSTHPGVQDVQRVALHEFGHALGLDHPDDAGQTVTAVMNSHASNVDSLQPDDIAGGQSLYGPPGVPANDNFASAIAITLSGTSATLTGFNTNATKETGEPSHAGNSGGRSVWWKWTAPAGGTVTLTTQGSVFDTTLAVYTGSAVNALTTITSNDDVQDGVVQYSSVTFSAAGGTTYYFAVDGFNAGDGHGADCGAVTLNLSFSASGPTTTTTSSSSVTSTSSTISTTTTTIPPTSSGGGGGGGGAPSAWFFGALSLLLGARRIFAKKE